MGVLSDRIDKVEDKIDSFAPLANSVAEEVFKEGPELLNIEEDVERLAKTLNSIVDLANDLSIELEKIENQIDKKKG